MGRVVGMVGEGREFRRVRVGMVGWRGLWLPGLAVAGGGSQFVGGFEAGRWRTI